ncbi:MAG: Flp pilus assembly complex ATPase component TadA, partial [Deltaproteobacteria bacterium]|nr:Flp pilus assembly complex ATPase component TadA [Deltaproteobacteria bacterium]
MKQQRLSEETLEDARRRLAHFEAIRKLFNQIHAAKDLDEIFLDLRKELLVFFDAAQLTLYAVDYEKKEVYSRFWDYQGMQTIKEVRVPIGDESIAGFVAKSRIPVNIADAYDREELAGISPRLRFDGSWDQKTGFRTQQVLAVPLLSRGGVLTGVIQLINKRGGRRFTKEDEAKLTEVAEALGIAFYNQYRLAAKKPTKFDRLVSSGIVTRAELDEAIREAREKQKDLESYLMEKHRIPKQEIGKSLSLYYQCPFLEFDERIFIDPELVKNINPNYLKVNYWVPLRRQSDCVEILIDDPHSFHKIQDIRRLYPVKEIKFHVGLREDILKYVSSLTATTDPGSARDSVSAILGELATEEAERAEESAPPVIDENDSAIVRLANQIIIDGYRAGASDVHVEPYSDKKETVVRFRVDGVCREYLRIPPHYRSALASRLKIMARLDIAERRKPQDGKIKFRLPDREIELRVA